MPTNYSKSMNRARKVKNDEYYTYYSDIEKELEQYQHYFKDKTIYLNADDENSNFYKYFENNKDIKRLIASHYTSRYDVLFHDKPDPYILDNGIKRSACTGDFRSEECLSLLNEADIVITNPPFSIFRQYFDIIKHKKFLVVSPLLSVGYPNIFEELKHNRCWMGINQIKQFEKSDGSIGIVPCIWLTNLGHNNKPVLELTKKYNEKDYPRYDNYPEAIEVSRSRDIPYDYDGLMGVPVSFIFFYNPSQFELIETINYKISDKKEPHFLTVNGSLCFRRFIIRRKN